jgi:hypothetical protein
LDFQRVHLKDVGRYVHVRRNGWKNLSIF